MIIVGLGLSIFFSILLLSKKQKNKADYLLSVWLLFISLHLFFFHAHINNLFKQWPFLIGIDFSFPMLHALFLYFYVRMVTSGNQRFYVYDILHFLPSLSAYLYIIPFFCKEGTEKYLYFQNIEINEPVFLSVFNIITILTFSIYTLLAFRLLKKHRYIIGQFFSFREKVQLNWLRSIIAGISVVWVTVFLIKILILIFQIKIQYNGEYIISVVVVLFVFFLGFFGIRQTTIFSDHQIQINELKTTQNENVNTRYKKSGLKEEQVGLIKEKLLYLMESEKRFRDNELTLDTLANEIGTSANNLSQVINEQFIRNFYDFVNDYRIEDFKQKATDSKFRNYSIIALALECGFSSKSAFYSVFKKSTGISPGEYLKKIL